MFKQILICSDGSEGALFAVRAGDALAKRLNAEARLLDVFNPIMVDVAEGMGIWGLAVGDNAISTAAQLQHKSIVEQTQPLFEAAGLSFAATQELGHPVGMIVEAAARV